MPRSGTTRARHALLIGIDRYAHFPPENQLKGCCRDVELMASLLWRRFHFRRRDIQLLRNQHATRDAILMALAALEERVGEGDLVVLQFSGHGSSRRDDDRDEPDGRDETFVPHDSGRGTVPNRDIADDELAAWAQCLSRKTPYLTLIFDSCHSGTIIRDGEFGARVRRLPADERPVCRQMRPPAPRVSKLPGGGLRALAAEGSRGDGYVLLAACSYLENAHELNLEGEESCGAFTYYLCQELSKGGSGDTYRELWERVTAGVNARFSSQHPQLEGARERQVLGTEAHPPMRFVPVTVRDHRYAVLDAGAAHGLTLGSEWLAYPQRTRRVRGNTPQLGRLRIVALKAGRARAEVVEERGSHAIAAGVRAVEDAHAYAPLRLAVEVRDAAEQPQRLAVMARCLHKSRLMRRVRPGEGADFCVYLLPPRQACSQAPVPQLETLAEPTWAVVDRSGALVMPPRTAGQPGAVATIAANLETLARFRYALQLENRASTQVLAGCADLGLLRFTEGQWQPACGSDEAGLPAYQVGEDLALAIRHRHSAPLYVTVLNFGLDGSISLVYPPPGARQALLPGYELRVGAGDEGPLQIFLPPEVPFDRRAFQSGVEYFKLFATATDTDFQVLLQSGVRDGPAPAPESLESLLAAAVGGRRNVRQVQQESWTTVTRPLQIVAGEGGPTSSW